MAEYTQDDPKTYTIRINRGGEAAKLAGQPDWIKVKEDPPGTFSVIDDNMTVKGGDWITEATALGFSAWDAEMQDLDNGESDASQCFQMSEHLRYGDDVDLTPDEFKAPSIEALAVALDHVAICAWCPGDI
jgi:hypothetical protein